jgi:hypothetical protein
MQRPAPTHLSSDSEVSIAEAMERRREAQYSKLYKECKTSIEKNFINEWFNRTYIPAEQRVVAKWIPL